MRVKQLGWQLTASRPVEVKAMLIPGKPWSLADLLASSASFFAFLMVSLISQASWPVVILGINVFRRFLKATWSRTRKKRKLWNLLGRPGLMMISIFERQYRYMNIRQHGKLTKHLPGYLPWWLKTDSWWKAKLLKSARSNVNEGYCRTTRADLRGWDKYMKKMGGTQSSDPATIPFSN